MPSPADTSDAADAPAGFTELVFSDYARYRERSASWLHVLALCTTTPGMLASVILRAQQCLFRSGRVRSAAMLRTVSTMLVSADFSPGARIGRGLLLVHPLGVVIGAGAVIGDNVTFAGNVTVAASFWGRNDARPEFATICDGAGVGANAVLVGGVRIGVNAIVGANSVVLSDVPDDTVAVGAPAKPVSGRLRP